MNDYYWADIAEAPMDGTWITATEMWRGMPISIKVRFEFDRWRDTDGTPWEPQYFVKQGKKASNVICIVQNPEPWDHVIQWEDDKFEIFIGAGGLPKDSGWDVLMSSGLSCTYQTNDPKAVHQLLELGYAISQQAADKLNGL